MWWKQLQVRGGHLAWFVGRRTDKRVQRSSNSNVVKLSFPTSWTNCADLHNLLFKASQCSTRSPSLNWRVRAGRNALPEFKNTDSLVRKLADDENCCQTLLAHHRPTFTCGVPSFGQVIGARFPLPGQLPGHRPFASQTASNRGEGRKASRKRSSQDSAIAPSSSAPHSSDQPAELTFEDCLRKFAPLIDSLENLRASWDDQKYFNTLLAQNASSSGKLLAFLDSILPQARGYPKAATYTLPFFVADGELVKKVQVCFRTTGGDCRKKVQEEFQRFFQECRIAQDFRWSPGSWGALHITGRESEQELREKARMIRRSHESGHETPSQENIPVVASTGGDDVSQAETPRGHGTEEDGSGLRDSEEGASLQMGTESKTEDLTEGGVSAANDRYGEHGSIFSTAETEGQEAEEGVMSIEELIRTLDPALKLIAEQAWGEHDEGTSKGVLDMLDGFKKSSPLLGEAIAEKIWKGRIGLEDVCEGLDQRDVAIAMSIVFHTHRLIEKKGRPKGWNGM